MLGFWKLKRKIYAGEIGEWIYLRSHNGCLPEDDYIKEIIKLREKKENDMDAYQKLIYSMIGLSNKNISYKIHLLIDEIVKIIISLGEYLQDNYMENKKKVEEILKNIDYSELSFVQWRRLLHLMTSVGMFAAGKLCREKMEKCVQKEPRDIYDKEKFGFYFEKGEYKKALELLNSSRMFQYMKKRYIAKYKLLEDACKAAMSNKIHPDYDDVDKKFATYVKEKKICIVAPSYRDNYECLKDYMDDADIKALLSYLFDGSQKELADVTTPKIIFYNVQNYERLKKESDKKKIDALDFIPTKKYINDKDKKIFKDKIRVMFPKDMISFFLFHGNLNMIQCVLLDMSFFETKVKIINANFYCAKKQFTKKKGELCDFDSWMNGFFSHDIIGNYLFTKNYYEHNNFEIDDVGKNILSLGLNNYIKEMESIYVGMYFEQKEKFYQ